MKKFINIMAIVLALVLAIGVFVACDPDEKDPNQNNNDPKPSEVTVIFDFDGVGNDVTLKGKAGETLAAPSASDTEDYYFGGWHLLQNYSDEAATPAIFPDKDTTYYAKWEIAYCFKATLEKLDGTFEAAPDNDISGRIVKGETNAITFAATDFAAVEGYHIENDSYSIDLTTGERDSVCEVKYLLNDLSVTYVTGLGDDVVKETKYGYAVETDDILGTYQHRHFMGWSESEGGEVAFNGGEELRLDGDLTLYAIWEIGLKDVLGGGDYLYISTTKSGAVYLERTGAEELFEGTIVGDKFTVKLSDSLTLTGYLFGEGFYYYRDEVEKTYKNIADEDETLEIVKGGDSAVLSGAGDPVSGKLEYNPLSGIYNFVQNDGKSFRFKLSEDGETFVKADAAEGNYIYRYSAPATSGTVQTYSIFELDGFGNVTEHTDPQGPYAAADGGVGEYEINEGLGTYSIYFEDGTEYEIKFSDAEKDSTVNGFKLKGSVAASDGLRGSYGPAIEGKVQKDKDKEDDLVLDGFGGGTYKDEKISYTLRTFSWVEESAYDDSAYGVASLYWVTFKSKDGEITLCIENSMQNNDAFYIPVKGEFKMEYFNDMSGLGSIYSGNTFEDYSSYLGVFIYKYGSESDIVAVFGTYIGSLTGLQVYSEIDWGHISDTNDGKGTYKYESTYEYFGKTHDVEFFFRYVAGEDGEYVMPQLYDHDYQVDDKFTLDIFGAATYKKADGTTVSVPYIYDDGFVISLLTFPNVDTAQGSKTFVYQVNFDDDGKIESFTYLEGFHQISENTNGCSIATVPREDGKYDAYIGLPQGDEFYYLIRGTAELESGAEGTAGATYAFDIDPESISETNAFLEAQGEDVFDMMKSYYHFRYRVTNVSRGECDMLVAAFNVTNKAGAVLALDETGVISLTMDGKTEKTSNFYYLLEDVLVLRFIRSGVRYDVYVSVSRNADNEISDFTVGGEEANVYYLESELYSGLEIFSRYFILLGDGIAVMANSSSGMSVMATYEATEKTFDWDGETFVEYVIGICYDSQDDIPDMFYTIAATAIDVNIEGGTKWHCGKYLQKTYADGDYEIVGGGSISSDGYHDPIYTDADGNEYSARLYFIDIEDRDFMSDVTPSIADGPTTHMYIGYYDENGDLIKAFLLDLIEGKLDPRDGYNGLFAEVVDNEPSLRSIYIYLDGQGHVTVYDSDDQEIEKGSYKLATELGEGILTYTPDNEETSKIHSFDFGLFVMDGVHVYVVYNAEQKCEYKDSDGATLTTDGFGQGLYVDKYGVSAEGLATYLTSTVVEFTKYGETAHIYFSVNKTQNSFGNFEGQYIQENGVLYRYLGKGGAVVIDDVVTEIGSKAFLESAVTSVTMNKVTKIASQAFEYCESLTEIIAPQLKEIGTYAFAGCIQLGSVDLPLVETIGDGAFRDCPLTIVKLGAIKTIGTYAFSHETSVLTEFDLFGCSEDVLAALSVEDEAFRCTVDGALGVYPINMKAFVKDIASLNKLIGNAKVSYIVKNTAGLKIENAEENDPMYGVVYVGFTNRSVYVFDGGTLVMRQGTSSSIFGVYTLSETDGVDIYVREESGYVKSLTNINGENNLTLGDEILFKNGVNHTVKTADNAYSVQFKFEAALNSAFGSIAVTATLNGEDAISAILSADNGTLRLAIGEEDTKYYDVRITGASSCEVSELGGMNVLYSNDDDKFYCFTGFIKDGKITELLSFGYHSSDSVDPQDDSKFTPNYSSYTVQNLQFGDDGSITFDWLYSSSIYKIKVKYVAGEQGAEDGIDVKILGVTITNNSSGSSGKAQITVTFDIDEYKVTEISSFAFNPKTGFFDDPIEEEIKSFTVKSHQTATSEQGEPAGVTVLEVVTENGTYTVTVTAQRNPLWGKMRTYSFSFTVEKTA